MAILLVFWEWYYGEAVKNVLTAWKNFIIFVLSYFSIPLLFKTLLAPWRRDITKRPRGLDFKKFFEFITFNLISRGTGFIVRFFTIIAGIISLIITIIVGAIFFVLWLVLPLILLGLLIFGILCLT
ncbi:MAG: hypothetical protein Q8N98_00130 [bacterium]|nr:hypothetical protein [bacterium]